MGLFCALEAFLEAGAILLGPFGEEVSPRKVVLPHQPKSRSHKPREDLRALLGLLLNTLQVRTDVRSLFPCGPGALNCHTHNQPARILDSTLPRPLTDRLCARPCSVLDGSKVASPQLSRSRCQIA
jgi:hypothetical protein